VGTVEAASGRLRVEMAASHHRRQVGIAAGTAGKDVADSVHRDRAARLLAPADEQAACLGVEIARRQAAHATLLRPADPRQLCQARPQPLAVDLEVPHIALAPLPWRSIPPIKPIPHTLAKPAPEQQPRRDALLRPAALPAGSPSV